MSSERWVGLATPQLREAAVELEGEIYRNEHGFAPPAEEGAVYFVATRGTDEVVASFRILGPSFRPFDLERFCSLDFLPRNRRPGLIGRLCVSSSYRDLKQQAGLHPAMMRLAFNYSVEVGITDLVLYSFSNLVGFYKRAMFRETGLSFVHPGYEQTMTVLWLDLDAAIKSMERGDRRSLLLYGQPIS